jgi:ssDNA-binding replication factor A large subunit
MEMKISDLKAGSGNVNIVATVVSKEEPREVTTKFGKRLNVTNATLKDDSGEIVMSLWGDDINSINVGDKIEVSNGYVNEFKGTPQLSAGKFGKITVLEKGDGKADSESKDSEEASSDEDSDLGDETNDLDSDIDSDNTDAPEF